MDRRRMTLSTAAAAAVVAAAERVLSESGNSGQSVQQLFDQFVQEDFDISPTLVTFLGLRQWRSALRCREDQRASRGLLLLNR
jgi:hypothetical protein